MRPFRPLLAVLVLAACGGDPASAPDAADDAVVGDTALASDVVDAVAPADAPREAAVDAPDVVVADAGADAAEVAQADAVDASPADAPTDTSGDAARDGGIDVPDVSTDVPPDVAADAPDVPVDVPVCLEGWRQCNGQVLELCQGNRWIPEPECARAGAIPGFIPRCYANACFFVCRTDTCIANAGGAGHEGVCRTDADCALNTMEVSGGSSSTYYAANGRCESGYCAFRQGRIHCPAADAGVTCYDLLPGLPRSVLPATNGCGSPSPVSGRCGDGFGVACTSDFDCPRSYRCDFAAETESTRFCIPR